MTVNRPVKERLSLLIARRRSSQCRGPVMGECILFLSAFQVPRFGPSRRTPNAVESPTDANASCAILSSGGAREQGGFAVRWGVGSGLDQPLEKNSRRGAGRRCIRGRVEPVAPGEDTVVGR